MYGSLLSNGATALAWVNHADNSSKASTSTRFDTRSSSPAQSVLLYTSPILARATYRLIVQFNGVTGMETLAVDRFDVFGSAEPSVSKAILDGRPFPAAAAAAIGFGCALVCMILVVALCVFMRRKKRATRRRRQHRQRGPAATENGANNILSWWDFRTSQNHGRSRFSCWTFEHSC